MEVNTGKDFSGDTVELIGRGPPGSYMAFSSVDYSLFQRGFHQFIDAEKVSIVATLCNIIYAQILNIAECLWNSFVNSIYSIRIEKIPFSLLD